MIPSNNHYETLELGVSASTCDIQAAYDRLLTHLTSPTNGLAWNEAARRLAIVNQAYWVLSDQTRRTGYDATLSPHDAPVRFAVEVREERWTLQKILFTVIGGTIALGLVSQILLMLYIGYVSRYGTENTGQAADKRSAEEIQVDKQQAEEKQLADEARRQERERQETERNKLRELDESRRYADQVSRELRHAEEQARYESEAERRRAAQEERAREEEERRRILDQKYNWQRELGRH
ncbi:MAG: DnaJ domain-containing protein [Sulfuricellaceae bacterium]|nr:DnaJ domain-containing protein [Sulfuricellaceae bacterium]